MAPTNLGAMYTIIGADGAEYGPVSEAQVRAWIGARRADGSTRIRRDGETEWRTIGELPEFTGSAQEPPPFAAAHAAAEDPGATSAEIAEAYFARGGRINVGNSFERAWNVLKGDFWPILGVTLLVMVLEIGCSQAISFLIVGSPGASKDPVVAASHLSSTFLFAMPLSAVVQVLFMSGLYYYYLQHLRGLKPTVGDAFKGFSRPVPIIVAGVLTWFFIMIGLCILILPGIYLAVAYSFTPILIVDKNLPAMKAMEVSRRLISRQWFTVFGLMILSALLCVAGLCALIAGILVALPLVGMAMASAYDSVVEAQP